VSRIVTKIKRPKEDVMNRLPRFVSGLSSDRLPPNELLDRSRCSVSDRRMDVSHSIVSGREGIKYEI
jgi:hypothetical protein